MRYANVMSTIAVFLSLGGVSYAVTSLEDNSVRSNHVVNSSLTGVDIKNGTIGGADLIPGTLGKTYFRYTQSAVDLVGEQAKVVITLASLPNARYRFDAQINAAPTPGRVADFNCVVHDGTVSDPGARKYALANDTRAVPASSAAPRINLAMHGVSNGVFTGGAVSLVCQTYGADHAPLRITGGRLTATALPALEITGQP